MVNKLYDGKLFYEVIVDTDRKQVFLSGPFDNIRYITDINSSVVIRTMYSFVQVINGVVQQCFTADQIMVLDAENR